MAKGGFPGMGGANMQQLMKQAQKMQQDMQRMQQELQTREFTATVGGGAQGLDKLDFLGKFGNVTIQ